MSLQGKLPEKTFKIKRGNVTFIVDLPADVEPSADSDVQMAYFVCPPVHIEALKIAHEIAERAEKKAAFKLAAKPPELPQYTTSWRRSLGRRTARVECDVVGKDWYGRYKPESGISVLFYPAEIYASAESGEYQCSERLKPGTNLSRWIDAAKKKLSRAKELANELSKLEVKRTNDE